MIELKVGDKFVVRSTPLSINLPNAWTEDMTLNIGKILTVKKMLARFVYEVEENKWHWYTEYGHVDWEATKKLHEKNKAYDWYEAIKMAAEGIPMCTERLEEHMELYNNNLHWVLNDGTIIKPVRVHQSNMWHNNWITYIKQIDLTDDEKAILRNLESKYKWIARDTDEFLYLFAIRPTKINHWRVDDEGKNMTDLEAFNHLFKQINWEDEEPTLIKELLGNI